MLLSVPIECGAGVAAGRVVMRLSLTCADRREREIFFTALQQGSHALAWLPV
jgi:hypothetical protein